MEADQAPPSLGFSRQEYWNGVPLPSLDLYIQFSSLQSLSRVRLLATPWTAAYQAPPSVGFSRQEYWSGVPLPSPICVYTCALKTKKLMPIGIAQRVFRAVTLLCMMESLWPCVSQSFQSFSHVRLLATPWTAAHQAPPSMGFFQARVLPNP